MEWDGYSLHLSGHRAQGLGARVLGLGKERSST